MWALVPPFWLRTGPHPADDAALPCPKSRLRRFVLTPHVQQALRAVAGAVCVFFICTIIHPQVALIAIFEAKHLLSKAV
jgi:hypothetical protein